MATPSRVECEPIAFLSVRCLFHNNMKFLARDDHVLSNAPSYTRRTQINMWRDTYLIEKGSSSKLLSLDEALVGGDDNTTSGL